MDDVDPCLDVRKGVRGGENSLSLELFVQISVCPAIQCEGCAVNKATQVVVFVKVCDAVLHLVRVEIRFHVGYLDERLLGKVNMFDTAS